MNQKTYSQKSSEVARKWYVIDASKVPLGRLATIIAQVLTGKAKSTYTPHIDDGDYVVVVNSDKLVVTGKKLEQKKYYRHSGYIGGIKDRTLEEQLEIDSTQVIKSAVSGMLPKNKLQSERVKRLKVYSGSEHEHSAQKPEELKV